MIRKMLSAMLCVALLLAGCIAQAQDAVEASDVPKYVFMFIGDGQGLPQINATQYYLGTLANPDAAMPTPQALSFTQFPYTGIMTTYDATSFCPDSASTATSMASGHKTLSGVINYDTELTEPFKLITEYAKEAGKKIGVVTSVSLDHATPAAYYAKVTSRKDMYGIAVQGLTGTTLDYLAGGGYAQPTGAEGDQQDVMAIAEENGWNIANTNEAIRALNADSGKTLAIVPDLAGDAAMQWEIDRQNTEAAGGDSLSLAEMVEAGIRVLDNENGFFMMTEGGKVDWSCHANDAMTSIYETIAFADAVQVAIDFAAEHPEETLIIVTGDHETGGLTIGFAATAYDTHFQYLAHQKVSYEAFDAQIAAMREAGASLEDALAAIEASYGLTTEEGQDLTLTADELERIEAAYALSMTAPEERELGDAEALAYGGYEPLSMAVCHILNNKAGVAFTSYSHTGLQIPIYAMGVNAELFAGAYDNCDIFTHTMQAMGLTQE